jgi:hypothetical protein
MKRVIKKVLLVELLWERKRIIKRENKAMVHP